MKTFKLSENSNLKYHPNFCNISKEDFKFIINECPKERHEIYFRGKKIKIPRFQQAYGESYEYSGTVSESKPMPKFIKEIADKIQKELYPKIKFNNCLCNWYLNGNHYVSSHSDDEKIFVKNTPVVGVTFCQGLPRILRIKEKKSKKTVKDILTYHNSLYVMEGNFQKEFKHEITKQKNCGLRISLTFRCFKD